MTPPSLPHWKSTFVKKYNISSLEKSLRLVNTETSSYCHRDTL